MTKPTIARHLGDADLTGLANKYALLYDAASGLWKPGAVSQPGHVHAGSEVTSVPLGGYVPLSAPVKLSDITPGRTAVGDYAWRVTDYVSGMPTTARAVNLILGGRWATASGTSYCNVYPYGWADTLTLNLTALVSNVNYFVTGTVNLTNGGYITQIVRGANMTILYLWATGYFL